MSALDNVSAQLIKDISPFLGKNSDRSIALNNNLTTYQVVQVRKLLGIPSGYKVFKGDIELDEKYSALRSTIGKESDKALSKKFNVPVHVILEYRRRHGIEALFKYTRYDYDDADTAARISAAISCLGKESDKDISRKHNLSYGLVRRLRTDRGIQPYLKSGTEKRKEKVILTSNAREQLLKVAGTKSDKLVGQDFNVSASVVKLMREQNSIPALGPRPGVPRKMTPELRRLLGTMLDGDLGGLFGIHKRTISLYRRELGISLFKDQTSYPPILRMFDMHSEASSTLKKILKKAGFPEPASHQELMSYAKEYASQLS